MAKSTSGTRSPITGALAKAFTKIARAASCVGRLTVDKDLLQLGSFDVEHAGFLAAVELCDERSCGPAEHRLAAARRTLIPQHGVMLASLHPWRPKRF